MPEVDPLLALYDAQLRAHVPDRLPAGAVVEREGPLVRTLGFGPQGWVEYRDLGDLGEAELDRLIHAQIQRFAERGESFEWKLHTHDRPPYLAARLEAAGFEAGELETVLIAETAPLTARSSAPDGVRIREVDERADLERIAELEAAVWGHGEQWRADALEQERAADPDALAIFVAEAGDLVVCAGWMRFPGGTDFATLWGGSTLPAWRGRGIYRALVHRRAQHAAARGRRYLQVDASAASRPILERLGFQAVTQTRPYVWARAAKICV